MNQALFVPQYQCFQIFSFCIRHALALKKLSAVVRCLSANILGSNVRIIFGLCKPLKINILRLVQGASYI